MIERHDIDNDRTWIPINDWNVDVNEVANACFIGPQGEILEKVQRFNDGHRRHMPFNPKTNINEDAIGITKKFYWKRGSYDNIKKIYSQSINRFSEKPRGMQSLHERIRNNSYSARIFWSDLEDIDQKIQRLRWQSFRWVDNTEVVRTYIRDLKHRITESIEINAVNFPNIDIEIYIDTTDGINATKIIILMHIKDISINIKHGGDIIGKVSTEDIIIYETINCWSHINDHCMSENPFSHRRPSYSHNSARGYFYNKYSLRHPFVSRNNSYYGDSINRSWTNICKGDHDSPWSEALWNLNIDVILHYANIWANNYDIPSTNPLNRISNSFFGLPLEMEPNVLIIPGGIDFTGDQIIQDRMDSCSFPHKYLNHLSGLAGRQGWNNSAMTQKYISGLDNHCDICQLKPNCTKSLDLSLYPFQKEGREDIDPDGLSDIPFIRQQLMMHITAQFLIRQGHFQRELIELREYCLITIDNILELAEKENKIISAEYNLDYWYTNAENANRNTETDVILERWDAILNNTVGTWEDLRDEYCDLVYGAEWNNLSSDDVDDFNDFIDGDVLALHNIIIETRENIRQEADNQNRTSTVIPEEELSVEDRAIRWAAQRGGAINFGQPNN